MSTTSEILKVVDNQNSQVVAQVVLNGYDIRAGVCTVPHGAMRSFKIVNGDLWDHWSVQASLTLSNAAGQEAQVRVAALPTEDDSFGLIEFI